MHLFLTSYLQPALGKHIAIKIHAPTLPLVRDLANSLSTAEVKTVTRYQKSMKFH